MDPKFNSLLAVVEHGNFTKAAKSLNLTQPAVSQHISQLENELNIHIFNKVGNTIIPTNEGEILIKYARRIRSLYKELQTKISDEKKQARSLKIGVSHSSEGNIIPQVLAEIARNSSGTTISIYSDAISNLYEKLSNYEIDLAVVEGKVSSSKFSKILLDSDSLVVVMSKENELASKQAININDLLKEKLILRTNSSATRTLFISQLESIGLEIDDFNVVLEMDNTSAIKDLVGKGIGVAVLPKSVCFNEIKNKTLIAKPIQDFNLLTEINLVFNKNSSYEDVIDEIVKTYSELRNI